MIPKGDITTNLNVFDLKQGVFPVGIGELTQQLPKDSFWLDVQGASAEDIHTVGSARLIPEPTRFWLPRFGQQARFEMNAQHTRYSEFAMGDAGQPVEPV